MYTMQMLGVVLRTLLTIPIKCVFAHNIKCVITCKFVNIYYAYVDTNVYVCIRA